ncbi:LmeA family phospholipid-binding protein [Streptomyces sp. NRAIS4]
MADHPLDEFLVEDSRATRQDEDAEEPWEPPNHRRGSRRRNRATGLPTLVRLLAWVLTLACLVTLADRWALLYAEHKTSEELKHKLHLAAAPEVHIGGFPFLTQLASQRLDSVSVTVPDIPAQRVTLTQVTATASDIRIDGDGPTTVRGALVRHVRGQVLLSFADMNRELGASQVAFTAQGPGRVQARGALHIAGRDLDVQAAAHIRRVGDRGIATSVDGIRLDIDDLATYRPGTGPTEGLHLTRASAQRLTREAEKIRSLLTVPEIVHRLGVPDSAVRAALHDEDRLHQLTGAPRFLHDLTSINLLDTALAHPRLLKQLGLDLSLLTALTKLTRPQIADHFSFAVQLPKPPGGSLHLQRVTVGKDGIRAVVSGTGLLLGR